MYPESRGGSEIPTFQIRPRDWYPGSCPFKDSDRVSRFQYRTYADTAVTARDYQVDEPVEVIWGIVDYHPNLGNWSPVKLKQPRIDR